MHARFPVLSVAALLLVSACREGSGSGPRLTNLGISAASLQGSGELWVLEVLERSEGASDLNGDGDTADAVPFVYDLADGSLTALGLGLLGPGPFVAVGDVLVAFGVSETDHGPSDLNGDGDASDLVLHVYDGRSGVATNTGLAATTFVRPAIGAGSVAFAVDEAAQGGQDLDGDGSASGRVLHVYDARTTLTTNAMRNVTSAVVFHDHAFAFTTDEAAAGADLNGDGDQLDTTILQVYDLLFGGITGVPLAIRGTPLAVEVDDWFALVDEGQQGLDLNGDLDLADGVIHRVEPHLPTIESLDLSGLDSAGWTANGEELGFVVREIDGLDRNGDGDLLDAIAVFHDPAYPRSFDSALAVGPGASLAFVERILAFAASESGQGLDLNGDGDQGDDVLHELDGASGAVTNLGLDVLSLQSGGGRFLFWRSEAAALEDWNGDGDQSDAVVFYRDPIAGKTTGTGLASASVALASTSASILLLVTESGEAEDLNGDLDLGDFVYVLHDVVSGTNTSLSVGGPLSVAGLPVAGLTEAGRGVLLVHEGSQGEDLNGDGDLSDSVLHRLDVP